MPDSVPRAVYHRVLLASFAAYCIANLVGWVLPDLISEFVTGKGFSESRAGLLGTVELASLAITSMLLPRLAHKASFLAICLAGTVVAIIATVASVQVQSHGILLVLRAIAGIGEGAALMVSSAALASVANPDRAYGQMNVVNNMVGTALILALPMLARSGVSHVAYSALLGGLAILLPVLLLMPRKLSLDTPLATTASCAPAAQSHAGFSTRMLLLAGVMFTVAMNSSAVWSFLVVRALAAGLDLPGALQVVALVAFVSIGGSLLATIVGLRMGRLWPSIAAIVLMTGCIVVLCSSVDLLLFRVCACLLVGALYFMIPYFMGYAAQEDISGKGAALVSGAFLLTVALAPYTGGLLLENFGWGAIAVVAVLTNAIAIVGLIGFDTGQKRQTQTSVYGPGHA